MPRPREPHDQPRTTDEQALVNHLTQDRAMHQSMGHDLSTRGYAYTSISDFLLRHGRWYRPRPRPRSIPRMAPKCCYANALLAGIFHGLRYVEGYAISVIPMPHAWGADAQGRLYELTWSEPGVAYLGVEFSLERADNASWFGDATVLDDYRRHWPLLQKPWQGEVHAFPWAASPWLALVRAGQLEEARRWLREHWLE